METLQSPFSAKAVDLVLWVGQESYPKATPYVREAEEMGVSKRIPVNSLPEGVVNGLTRLFLKHRRAIPVVTAKGKTFRDLVNKLVELSLIAPAQAAEIFQEKDLAWSPLDPSEVPLFPADFVPPHVFVVTMALDDAAPEVYKDLAHEFGIKWQAGIVGFTFITEVQFTLPKGVEQMPKEQEYLLHRGVTPVHVEYVDDDGNLLNADDHSGEYDEEG